MKSNYKNILFLFIAFVMVGTFISCSDDDLPNNGKPSISYIRVTNAEASDSLLVAAGQGSMIAIIGQNLQGAKELWINDRQASLTPTYITNTTIITRIPSKIPDEVDDKIKIIFEDGSLLEHSFKVKISKPLPLFMVSEYVNIGDVAIIRGDYFYEPLTVTFTGGVVAEIVELEDDIVKVVVPEGAEPGPITLENNIGETVSGFWFRDDRNIIADFEETNFEGWWHGKDFIVSADARITPISNKFLRINKELGAWDWFEMWVGDGGTILEATKNIPADAFLSPRNYSLKFEINTLASLTGANLRMYMGPAGLDMGKEREAFYLWEPNIDTKGEWQTVIIPFDQFMAGNPKLEYSANGYQVSFHFQGPSAAEANFGLDNIRVVPNK